MTALTIRKSEVDDTGCIRKMGEPCQIWKRVYSSIRVKDVARGPGRSGPGRFSAKSRPYMNGLSSLSMEIGQEANIWGI